MGQCPTAHSTWRLHGPLWRVSSHHLLCLQAAWTVLRLLHMNSLVSRVGTPCPRPLCVGPYYFSIYLPGHPPPPLGQSLAHTASVAGENLPSADKSLSYPAGGLRREAILLKKMHHPGIVQCTDVVDDGRQLVLILEWLRGGPLLDQMHRIAGDTYTEQQAAVIFSQVNPSVILAWSACQTLPSRMPPGPYRYSCSQAQAPALSQIHSFLCLLDASLQNSVITYS